MKTEYKERESDTVKSMIWYSWIETCDDCGKIIHGHEIETTKKPDFSEKDYCINCLRKRIEERLSVK